MAIADEVKKYLAHFGREPLVELQAAGRGRVLALGESHSALFRSIELLEALISGNGYRYLANEWFFNAGPIRRGMRRMQKGRELPPVPANWSQSTELEVLYTRFGPFKPLLRQLRQHRIQHLAVGTRQRGEVRDQRIAVHYVDETSDRGLSRRSPGIALFGAAHAAAVHFFNGRETTRQILESYGWTFASARIFEGGTKVSPGWYAPEEWRDYVKPLDGADSFPVPDLLPKGVSQLAVQTRLKREGKQSPFYSVREIVRTGLPSGRSVAEQYEVVVLARDP